MCPQLTLMNCRRQNLPFSRANDLSSSSSSSSSNKVQATVVDYRTGACGARKTIYR